MAYLMTRLGAKVMICGRRLDKLEQTQAGIRSHLGRDIDVTPMTIRDPDQVDALFEKIYESIGQVDVVINSAGGQFSQAAIDFSRKGWMAVIDTNLNGTWWMMQAAAQRWRDTQRPGNIINIAANVSRGMPQSAHSCAARAGVIYLSKTVSTEWAPLKIRVNCIAPGSVQTEGFENYSEAVLRRFYESNPMKTLGDAWDIAEGAAYLAAPSARFITGEVLTIDGGMQQFGWAWPAGLPDYFRNSSGS
jgi:citronellol/citronellal dehydrogenase